MRLLRYLGKWCETIFISDDYFYIQYEVGYLTAFVSVIVNKYVVKTTDAQQQQVVQNQLPGSLCVSVVDPRLSDPGDGVQAQLRGASSSPHGLREVSQWTDSPLDSTSSGERELTGSGDPAHSCVPVAEIF